MAAAGCNNRDANVRSVKRGLSRRNDTERHGYFTGLDGSARKEAPKFLVTATRT